MNRCASRILSALKTGGRKPNVLRGLAFDTNDFEQAIGQLFLDRLRAVERQGEGARAHAEGEGGVNDPRQIPEQDRWRLYEAQKFAWSAAHPEATPLEYEQAMQEIAKRCGV